MGTFEFIVLQICKNFEVNIFNNSVFLSKYLHNNSIIRCFSFKLVIVVMKAKKFFVNSSAP